MRHGKSVVRSEQAAAAALHRELNSKGAFAILYGLNSRFLIKKPEVGVKAVLSARHPSNNPHLRLFCDTRGDQRFMAIEKTVQNVFGDGSRAFFVGQPEQAFLGCYCSSETKSATAQRPVVKGVPV